MHITPGAIVGIKYRLERPLSRGGMGAVWLARHVHLGSPVAMKFMDPTLAASPAFVARFEREARIAANLQSPHVVNVQDYGIDEGVPYLVMELLQGEDLGTRLARVGRLSLAQTVHVLGQVAKAIRRAHEAGLVHRDLKPGNIFLSVVEDEEVAKVLDFGIVKEGTGQMQGELTRPGEVLGSPHYMSPEQVRGEADVDLRSDLWALGVITFRMLTGVLPFPGDQLGTVMGRILVDPLPQATRFAPDLPPALDGFFARALSRDRATRMQSVVQMLDELRSIAGTGPASPRGAERSSIHSYTNEVAATPGPMSPAWGMTPSGGSADAGVASPSGSSLQAGQASQSGSSLRAPEASPSGSSPGALREGPWPGASPGTSSTLKSTTGDGASGASPQRATGVIAVAAGGALVGIAIVAVLGVFVLRSLGVDPYALMSDVTETPTLEATPASSAAEAIPAPSAEGVADPVPAASAGEAQPTAPSPTPAVEVAPSTSAGSPATLAGPLSSAGPAASGSAAPSPMPATPASTVRAPGAASSLPIERSTTTAGGAKPSGGATPSKAEGSKGSKPREAGTTTPWF
ncbi:serine/threonine-protein kinase [Chondromyces crocatus]|uniref:Protein kinase n=1 Tax=Chondromyces crocatus TaxID=52 RepID=A0A0K1E9L8_CHOCO|nr:serine/threonine-protein kinase [Chondromyces crocatus]AKT37382.1 protein kinase [Chondromyces crocatus]